MPYAGNDRIAQDPFDGSVEITDKQYAEALEGMCGGLVVSIDSGFEISLPVLPESNPTEVVPTNDELAASAISKRDELLSVAAIRIAPLQDAIDLGDETTGDTENLKLWKQYRVALNRIDQQSGFPSAIDWPATPI